MSHLTSHIFVEPHGYQWAVLDDRHKVMAVLLTKKEAQEWVRKLALTRGAEAAVSEHAYEVSGVPSSLRRQAVELLEGWHSLRDLGVVAR